jgi:GT2 family glycosyltransferase
VTYGAFRPDEDGFEFPPQEVVERDFAQMAANGFNAVRSYTVPPCWLLDLAQERGLRVMVGLTAELYVGYLTDTDGAPDLKRLIRERVRQCAGHPAVLCYSIANEIPAASVRWLGPRRVEQYIKRLYEVVKDEDPEALVTYVNYPTTEYLELPFLDLACFNVYLEDEERLAAYVARLHNIVGDRPLLMSEFGLDSLRNGENTQAEVLEWQLRTSFAGGAAGAFVFSWTDEWYAGGVDVEDWDFGLTRRDRTPKPALASVRGALGDVPMLPDPSWPRISVVVCSYNGQSTLGECLNALTRLEYPDYEVIVVDDGSTDQTAQIAREFGFPVISTENRGLSSARNTGWQAATGEIVAYIDDDAYPDVHWLTYLAHTFTTTDYAGVGGPNVPPDNDGPVADCVANAPGGPIHVLLSDREAEHIPGCNMAFRRSALEAVGGFDPRLRVAGDDVDLCWRIQESGWKLGFNPSAMVWHRRRNCIGGYWKQQVGYGKAEALLEQKWPEKYNTAGHIRWAGRIYGQALTQIASWPRGRIYMGTWGSAPFQSLYQPAPSLLASLLLMPEWYLVNVMLAGLSLVGIFWSPLLFAIPLLLIASGASVFEALRSAARSRYRSSPASASARLRLYALTFFLHLLQPLARLCGRFAFGLTPWRIRGVPAYSMRLARTLRLWSEAHRPSGLRLESLEAALRGFGVAVRRGDDFDRWDLQVQGGLVGGARLLMAVEEHAGGKQLIRIRCWPWWRKMALGLIVACSALSGAAALNHASAAAVLLGVVALGLGMRMLVESGAATAAVLRAIGETQATSE